MSSCKEIGITLAMVMHFALTHYHTQTEYTSIESAIQAQNSGEIILVLDLKKQKLTSVPNEIKSFTELIELRLDKNRIQNLPEWLSDLTHLEIFSAERNRLVEIPSVILELKNLKELYLGDNLITVIPIDIDVMENLEWLGLWSNLIRIFPSSLSDMPKLKTLDILYNDMTYLEQTWLLELLPSINVELSEPCHCKLDDE